MRPETAQQLLFHAFCRSADAQGGHGTGFGGYHPGYLPRNAKLCWCGFALLMALMAQGPSAQAAAGGQPFVIHETYEQQSANIQPNDKVNHGIVGLDLLIQKGDYPLVHGVFRGTPAASQGLLPGDVILAVNGVTTLGKSLAQVDQMISDVPGDRVMLMVQRGERLSQVKLTVASLDALPPVIRSEFSGLFGNTP